MITIKSVKGENEYVSAEMHIAKGTPHITYLLGIEMLVEALLQQTSANLDIDKVLEDVKRIYLRDNPQVDTK